MAVRRSYNIKKHKKAVFISNTCHASLEQRLIIIIFLNVFCMLTY